MPFTIRYANLPISDEERPHAGGGASRTGGKRAILESSLLVVGNPFFLARHRPLIDALGKRFRSVEELPIRDRALVPKAAYVTGAILAGRLWPPRRAKMREILQRFTKEPATFARISRLTARRIAARNPAPGLVLQIFSMSSPVAGKLRCPYAHYVDMTMAQARAAWPAWAPFESQARYEAWIALEGASYRNAERVFTFSEATRRSVIDDYGARRERVVAVGAAGHYDGVAHGDRTYGNRSLIFNGSDFERKGGDRVRAAFELIRNRFPDATLTVVATSGLAPEPGIRMPGQLTLGELFARFDETDIVIAPTRWDAFPGFVLEAMSRGVVPILSDAPPMDEIARDGIEGYIASPPTPENLAALVATLFTDQALLRRLGNAARDRVARDWNWDAVAEAMMESLAADDAAIDVPEATFESSR
jgi:glycosyltransferase involved in cell wall biosynthesis